MFDEIGEAFSESTIGVMGPKGGSGGRTTNAPANRRRTPFLNDIRDLAYKKWIAAGTPPGDCARFWLEAEQEVQQGR